MKSGTKPSVACTSARAFAAGVWANALVERPRSASRARNKVRRYRVRIMVISFEVWRFGNQEFEWVGVLEFAEDVVFTTVRWWIWVMVLARFASIGLRRFA